MQLESVIKGALVSEASMSLAETGVYSIKVDLKATKQDIKSALKDLFNVDVLSVNTSILRGRESRKLLSRKGGPSVNVKKANIKKAFVKLAKGQSIPFVATTGETAGA